jgi:hypothetical protein
MGLKYALTFDHVASPATAAFDAFEITAPADAAVVLHSLYLSQTSDMGDAAAEQIPVQIIKGYTTSGSVGGTAVVNPLETGFPAQGSTCEVMNTTVANTGTAVILHTDGWNIAIPYQYRPTPEERLILSPSQRVVVRVGAHADALTIGGTIIFEELGG